MAEGPDISRVAALIGDPARASMLSALMRGQALTAAELACEAGIAPPTASAHLARLLDGGLARVRPQGRHRYYTLASAEVAALLETLMRFSAGQAAAPARLPGPRDPALRRARLCYDHLAGEQGVRLYDSLWQRGCLAATAEGLTLTEAGRAFARDFGIDLAGLEAARPPLCRECLDWSARRSHLGGRLGRAIWARIAERGWARRSAESRAVLFSTGGAREFALAFPVAAAEET